MSHWRAFLALAPLASLAACEIFTEPLGGLEVSLTAPVDTTVPGEPVTVTILVRNPSVFPIQFHGNSSCTFGIEVLHPDGSVTGREDRACWSDLRIWSLRPGDSVVVERRWSGREGPAGTYRLRPFVNAHEGLRRGPAVRIEVPPSARVRLVHTHPALPALDLVVAGRRAVVGALPGLPSEIGVVRAGPQAVEVRETGAATPIARGEFEFLEGSRHTFAVREGPGGPEPWPIPDADTVVSPNLGRLRLIHLAVMAPDIAVSLTTPAGQESVEVAFPFPYGVVFPYLTSDPGWWTLVVTTADRADTLARSRVLLGGGQVRTLLLLDESAGGILGLLLEP
ncbi:MAG TPA: DUF4397 domain-containing protein [Gemmatimonadales bacterium]|jgi:hypothetical protein